MDRDVVDRVVDRVDLGADQIDDDDDDRGCWYAKQASECGVVASFF